ncbi:unnamed protein product [Bursaphelenchus xylophilus]|uniref:(pine wood nematode) hypothetical protein n=1 Tax=Bursaphelenchus xylophilus TaxID=6326 RepID=A0A1I7SB57_BURXY|nr:unnamed protein product [Bursaphelenchus xylophilus]CAG9115872.1 unnamed protein product [Bursaphelenchus xylophilus]
MVMVKITHVIFDFDGVLIDSETQYSTANQNVLNTWGKEFTLDKKLAMMGTKKSEAMRTLIRMSDLEGKVTPEEYEKIYDVQLDKLLAEPPELPGADHLINHLFKNKIPMAICTGSDEWEFDLKTKKLYKKWLEKIPLRVLSGSDPEVKHGKPAPDPYLVTLQRMAPEVDPANVLVFEDSINGVKSALAAGMNCVMIPQWQFVNETGKKEIESLKPRLAELLDSLEQFKPERYGLPPF